MLQLLSVALGWALGFVSSQFVEWAKGKRRRTAARKAIAGEFHDVAYRLVCGFYMFELRTGVLKRESLTWLKSNLEAYEQSSVEEADRILAHITGLLDKTDKEIAAVTAHDSASRTPLTVPILEAPYAASAMTEAHLFTPGYSKSVLDILAHIRMFNDVREEAIFYRRLTFRSDLDDKHKQRAIDGTMHALRLMAQRARIIVDKISALQKRENN